MSKKFSDYIKSNKWKKLRNDVLERDNYSCQHCGSKIDLREHHLTYKRLFDENPMKLKSKLICQVYEGILKNVFNN